MGKRVVIVVRQESLGSVTPEDRSFGFEMFDRFLHTLESQAVKPQAICFYTEGVKLACEGSPLLLSLRLIESMGVRLVVCTSCLEHFMLRDRVAVGEIGSMTDIVQLMMEADSVVTV